MMSRLSKLLGCYFSLFHFHHCCKWQIAFICSADEILMAYKLSRIFHCDRNDFSIHLEVFDLKPWVKRVKMEILYFHFNNTWVATIHETGLKLCVWAPHCGGQGTHFKRNLECKWRRINYKKSSLFFEREEKHEWVWGRPYMMSSNFGNLWTSSPLCHAFYY